MKIVIAPNAFKEALSAHDAARAIAKGFRRALPDAELIEMPVSDGGDGLGDVLLRGVGGKTGRRKVTGPVGEAIQASLIRLAGDSPRTFCVEVADTSGLQRVPEKKRNPMKTTTRGLGELIAAAIDAGAERVLVGLGGSGTVDGGSGMAAALGFKLLDERDKPISDGGRGLLKLARIVPPDDWSAAKKSGTGNGNTDGARPAEIIAVCDVRNPLLGNQGAATVYGPQKGATDEMVDQLEEGLANLARCIKRDLGRDVKNLPGAGAAGGLGAGLAGFLAADLRPGAELVLDLLGFDNAIEDADWVITAEGKLDAQTSNDKAPSVVARQAGRRGVPTIALGGSVALEKKASRNFRDGDFAAALSILPGPTNLEEAMKETSRFLEQTSFELGALLAAAASSSRRRA